MRVWWMNSISGVAWVLGGGMGLGGEGRGREREEFS